MSVVNVPTGGCEDKAVGLAAGVSDPGPQRPRGPAPAGDLPAGPIATSGRLTLSAARAPLAAIRLSAPASLAGAAGGRPLTHSAPPGEGDSRRRGAEVRGEAPGAGPRIAKDARTAAHVKGRARPRAVAAAAPGPAGAVPGTRQEAAWRHDGAERARFRPEPEVPTVAASGTAGGRAKRDRKVRSGSCPSLQARPVAAARHWAPGAARRRGPGPEPPAQPWSRPPALHPGGGRGRLLGRPGGWGASRPGRVTPAGAPAAATGAGPPRDWPQSRCA